MATYRSNMIPFKEEEQDSINEAAELDTCKNIDLGTELAETNEEIEVEETKHQDDRHNQHAELIRKLRLQLRDLERYAYEKGELDKIEAIPASVLAERQTLVLEALKEKLPFKIGPSEIESLGLEDLKKQVEKEIHDLVEPLQTKDFMLKQLQTQLNDLERYISHLHAAIGRPNDKNELRKKLYQSCSCQLHGCNQQTMSFDSTSELIRSDSLLNNESLPKTSRLIRSLIAQLICSDAKLQERTKVFKDTREVEVGPSTSDSSKEEDGKSKKELSIRIEESLQRNSEPLWSSHIDKVILATDSLVNLFTLEPRYQRSSNKPDVDDSFIESIVRRQFTPAIRDLLSYGLVESSQQPRSSYSSLIFDPYSLILSLTCFPGSSQKPKPSSMSASSSSHESTLSDREHIWNVIIDYFNARNESEFKSSSIRTLSQSFNLEPSVSGPIKITSKQALLIAVDDIIRTLTKCKPNGPESHFRTFIYTALNRSRLSTWIRLIFRNKTTLRKHYHNYSFVYQQNKMEKFLETIEVLNRFKFNLRTDVESIEKYVSAF